MAIKLTRLPQTARNIGRFYEIVRVLGRHGFGEVVGRIGFEGSWAKFKRIVTLGKAEVPLEVEHLRWEERVRLAFEELGSTYIKFGQILATRPDLVPMSLIHELRKLQDKVPPFDAAVAKKTIEDEIGAPTAEVFAEFDEKPLAAASIAQVHRAKLKNGDEVVIKVQRPGLQSLIDNDLDLLHVLAEMVEENLPEMKRWQPVAIVEEFDKSIHKEIDFGREAHNIKRFAKNFQGDPQIYAPRVYDDLSTSKILVMEFINGIKMNSDEIFKRQDLDRKLIAETGIKFTLTQVFVHGFFHADPHPGNVFIMKGNIICLIDYGMMGSLDQERIDDLLGFLVAVLTNNPERMIRQFQKQGLVDESVNTRGMSTDIADLMERYLGMEVAKINVAIYIQQLFDIITRYRIVMPADLLLMGKSLATVDGIARDIYPELDPLGAIRPYILQIYFKRLTDPEFYTRDTRRAAEEALLFLQRLPRDLRLITSRLRDGELKLKLLPDGAGWDRYIKEQGRSSNRLSVAVLIVGLLAVGSYLITNAYSTGFMTMDGGLNAAGQTLFALGVTAGAIAGLSGLGYFYGYLRSGGP